MTNDDKLDPYQHLVRERKACRECAGLANPAAIEGGQFDSDQIGPWSLWQGNRNARLMVVGQDWGTVSYFKDNKGRDYEPNPTNTTLRSLLRTIEVECPVPATDASGGGELFFTNAILCLKEGNLQSKVLSPWFDQCGARFLRPTIELVAPRVVVTLGQHAYRGICKAFGLKPFSLKQAVAAMEGQRLNPSTRLLPVYHCGVRTLNINRSYQQQVEDWRRVRKALE